MNSTTIDIKNPSGQTLLTAPVTDSALSHEELMAADYVQLSWNSDTGTALPAGAYIEHNGEKFSLLEPYTPTRANEAEYQYAPQFQSRIMGWQKHIVPIYTYEDDGVTVKTREMDWDFTGSPADAMYMVQQAIKNETGEQWTVQLADSLPATITLSSQSGSIFSLLNDIAGQCDTEWWADKATNTLYLSRCQHGTPIALTVGGNVGVPSVTTSKDGYYTRFYVFGSTRNVTQPSGAAVTNSIVNKRLTLDPATYPGGYIDVRPNLQQGEIFTKNLYYDDIYPSSKLVISDVRPRLKYRLDGNSQKIQTGTDSEGNPVYEQYAIWYFQIAGFDFDPKDIIPQLNLSAHFETGQLAGRDFELNYHDKAETVNDTADVTAFNVKAGDYEILIDESGGTIIPGLAYIIPQDGDKVILYNIEMPAEYTASAREELAETAKKDIAKMTADNNSYEMDSYPVAFRNNNTDLTLGQTVTYTNGDTVLQTRVLMVEKHLDYPCQQRIRVGNAIIKGNTQQLREEVTQASQNIDILAAFNNLSSSVSNAYAKVQREMLEGFARIGNMWKFDPNDPTVIYSDFSAYVNGFLSAKGLNPDAGATPSGATTLGGLSNVGSWADAAATEDRVMVQRAGSSSWTAMALADIAGGLDEEQLAEYLTTHQYTTQEWITQQGYATQSWASGQFAKATVAINAGTGLTGGGTLSASRTLSLATVGMAGTYTKVTVDAYGRVTGHGSLAAGDIPALDISKITGLQDALDAKMDAEDKSDFMRYVDTVTADGDTLYSAIGIRSFSGCYPDSLPEDYRLYNYGEGISFPVPNGMRFDLYVNHNSSSSLSTYKDNGVMFRTGFHNNTINGWRMLLDEANYNSYVKALDNLTHAVASDYIQVGSARLRYDSANNALYVEKSDGTQCGFYTTGFLSTKGANADAGGAVAGVTELSKLTDVAISNPQNGQSLVYQNGEWVNVLLETGASSWSEITGKPSWIGSTKPSYSWSEITGKPSTFAPASHTHTFASLTGKPTTLAGYGITDAYTKTEADDRYVNAAGDGMTGTLTITTYDYGSSLNIVRNNNTSAASIKYSNASGVLGFLGVGGSSMYEHQPIFSQSGSGEVYMIWHSGNAGSGSGLDADTLDGKHYTDIINGNVTSATRLQTVRTLWGRPFDGTANVSGDMTGVGSITMSGTLATPSSVTASEFLLPDEHLRIFHDASTGYAYVQGPSSGKLRFSGLWGTTLSELYVQAGSSVFSGSIQTDSYIQVGSARLRYDSAINALYVEKSDGTQCGFYATGFLSTKGLNPDAGSTPSGATTLGGLSNVGSWADAAATEDRVMVQRAGSSSWTAMALADIAGGLDEEQLAEYLTTHQYTTQEWITQQGYATQSWASGQFAKATVAINAGTGLTGGGTLSASRTLSLATVGTAGTYTKVTVDAYGRVTGHTSLAAGDIPNLPWSKITSGKPTTLSGYGITDAYSKTDADSRYVNVSGDTMTGGLSIKTYNYGDALNVIRNSNTSAGAISFSNNTGLLGIIGVGGSSMYEHQPIFSQSGSGEVYMIWHSGNAGSGSGLDADLLDGVHLSDIRNGNVYSATRLQTARTLWGQPFDGTENVSGAMTGVTTITASGAFRTTSTVMASELLLSNNMGRIFYDSSSKYTYIQSSNNNMMSITGLWGAQLTELIISATKVNISGTAYASAIEALQYIQVGSARLRWDSANNALYVQKSDGTQCGFYATGFLSAKGANDNGGDTEATVLTIADERNTAIYPDTYAGRGIRGLFRANATDGLNDGGTYHTVLHIRQWANSNGGLSHQLAFTDNGGVWHRTATSETAWGEWSELSALSGLGDVAISSPVNGQALIYRDGVWKNETVNYGITMDVDWDDVKNKPAWISSTKPSYSFSEITGTPSVTVSSSSSTNLTVNVEGASKSVPSLYATYLGGTTKAGLFTGMTYSGNTLSVTVGGTTRSVTINAGSSGNYLPLTGGTVTGSLTVNGGITTGIVEGRNGAHLYMDSKAGYDVGLRRGGSTSNAVSLGDRAFRPFSASSGASGITLGSSSYRWATIYSVNSLNTSSDLRLKSVHADIPLTVAQVAAAPSFLYRWKKGTDKKLHAGSSAQYWKDVLPQAVERGADGYLAMVYDRIALAAAIAVARTVTDHEERIKRLEKMIS